MKSLKLVCILHLRNISIHISLISSAPQSLKTSDHRNGAYNLRKDGGIAFFQL